MIIMKNTILSLLLALGTLTAVADTQFAEISTADLKQAIKSRQVVLLDVNGTESWQKGHIPSALNFAAVKEELTKKLPADKNALVVAYCGNEHCGAYRAAALAAQNLGYKNVKHYAKGIQGWVKIGETTEKGS